MVTESKLKWNPYTSGYFTNPYVHLKLCRESNPVQKIFDNSYLICDYHSVNKILRQKDYKVHSISEYLNTKEEYIFKGMEGTCPFLSKATEMWPMYLNGAIHRKIRRAITMAFNALPIEVVIQESLQKLLNEYEDNASHIDLTEYCGKFIYFFIKKVMGITCNEYEEEEYFSNLLAKSQDIYIPRQVYQEINAKILEHKGTFFADSLFKDKLIEETKDLNLNEDQIYSAMLISFMGAFETSKDNLSLGLLETLKSPELIDYTLSANKQELQVLTEELFRFSSPLQYTIRINTEDLVLGDITIPQNSKLYLCIASANRDESIFENPDSIIPNRENNPHLAFGGGTHLCLGAKIAKQEVNLCLQPMLSFLKNYTIQEVTWSKQIFMRTVAKVLLQKA